MASPTINKWEPNYASIVHCAKTLFTPEYIHLIEQLHAHVKDDIESLHTRRQHEFERCQRTHSSLEEEGDQDDSDADSIDRMIFGSTGSKALVKEMKTNLWTKVDDFYHNQIDQDIHYLSNVQTAISTPIIHLADIDPSDAHQFKMAILDPYATGIQADMDDGSIPIMAKILIGHYNLKLVSECKRHGSGSIRLMDWRSAGEQVDIEKGVGPEIHYRPRALNMKDFIFSKLVPGTQVCLPAALIDITLYLFHCRRDKEDRCDIHIYLSKLEHGLDARLWHKVLCFCEMFLGLRKNSTRVCVLIESISAMYYGQHIVQELAERIYGINAGIFDFIGSLGVRHGKRMNKMLPERGSLSPSHELIHRYLMEVRKLATDNHLVLTGGMVGTFPFTYTEQRCYNINEKHEKTKQFFSKVKRSEVLLGYDGFLVYQTDDIPDIARGAIGACTDLIQCRASNPNAVPLGIESTSNDYISINAVIHCINTLVHFCLSWIITKKGSFIINGSVEDSATAEISRASLSNWLQKCVSIATQTGPNVACTSAFVDPMVRSSIDKQLTGFILDKPSTQKYIFDIVCRVVRDTDRNEVRCTWFEEFFMVDRIKLLIFRFIKQLIASESPPMLITDAIQTYIVSRCNTREVSEMESETVNVGKMLRIENKAKL